MTASQAARPPTAGPSRHLDESRWQQQQQHGPSSSTPVSSTATSDQLTPESDSDDDDAAIHPNVGLLGQGHGDSTEVYELKDRREQSGPDDEGHYASDDDEKDDSHGGSRLGRGRRAGSTSTAASFTLYTPDEERAVVRKFDRKLVVFVALLYMLSFLDRSNIGNARIAGMDDDLQSIPPQEDMYEWALTAFYIAYILFEWMSLLWKVIPAHIYVSVIVLSWGCIASIQAVSVNYPMLIFLRTLLGIGEAAFTGVPFYLSFFFRRDELAFRTAMFISAAPLATSFASSLSWLIIKLGEKGPIAPWRLLFLIEGFPSVLVAVVAWNVIPDSPETAHYLTPREKRVARLRLRHEQPRRSRTSSNPDPESKSGPGGLDAAKILSVLSDPAAWLTGLIFFLANMAYSSLPVFLPTILTRMGHSALSSQLLAAPPYLSSFFIVLATAHMSDKMRARGPLLIAAALASAAGYAVLALSSTLGLKAESTIRYLAVYPAAAGFFTVVVLTISWSINNQADESRRGGGFALLQVLGQCGPLVGARLYPVRAGPFYTGGMAVCAGAMTGVAVLALGLRWYLSRLNKRLDVDEGVDDRGDGEGIGLVGGRGAGRRFRYML
ncbi:MFS general substrate transporter [Coniochaeta sp. PMI_546]|nr:MFS general substrate transporter [Coniochaeta sp. PMI_546]